MTRRINPAAYEALLVALWERQKGVCPYCAKPAVHPQKRLEVAWGERPTVHHTNGNAGDDRYAGQMLHHACNTAAYREFARVAVREKVLRAYGLLPEAQAQPALQPGGRRERESQASVPPTLPDLPGVRVVPARESDSYSNRKSQERKPQYFAEAFRVMLACYHGSEEFAKGRYFAFDELNDAFAMKVGEVPQTTARYMGMLKSMYGPFDEVEDKQTKKLLLVWRFPYYAYLEVEELLRVWPVDGIQSVKPEVRAALLGEAQARFKEAESRKIQERFGP
jgi:hypothetical protein